MDPRRLIPRTDVVLDDPRMVAAAQRLGRPRVKAAVVAAQGRARAGEIEPARVADAALAQLPAGAGGLRPVLNATGVVLHTNLGRAALSETAQRAVVAAAGHTDVELDLTTGRRARRGRDALAALRAAVPAAGDAHVVNNGAAALVLAATALAAGKEIVVSRGELVEIGDGFRLPDLLESTGARLREVGTTNQTSLADYRAAVGERTGFILKVHPSNFVVTGFTGSVPPGDLTGLGVPVVVDIGSGLLAPEPLLPDEPDAASALRQGADLVVASGDKLLGGPQAGLLLGAGEIIERLRRHPLARALRVDKLTLAALHATLTGPETPTWRALRIDRDALKSRTEAVVLAINAEISGGGGRAGLSGAGSGSGEEGRVGAGSGNGEDESAGGGSGCGEEKRGAGGPGGREEKPAGAGVRGSGNGGDHGPEHAFVARVVETVAVVGGGGAPEVELPSWAVGLPEELAVPLRTGDVPVVGRVEKGALLLDLRCVAPERDADVVDAVRACRS